MASRKKSGMLPIFLIGLFLLLTRSRSLTMGMPSQTTQPMKQQTPKNLILDTLTKSGIDSITARYWVAVSAHETGGWNSRIYLENHNLFGMRLPSRNTTAIGERYGHAVFANNQDSALDLVKYFDRLKWGKLNFVSPSDLVNFMKSKGYFTDTVENYLKGVQFWLTKI